MASSIAQFVKTRVEGIPPGHIFDYASFNLGQSEFVSLASALSRLVKAGTIARLSKGKYYKPEETKFGKFGPSERDVIESLTFRKQRRIGYLTGVAVYNQLGLTSQVPSTLVIATNTPTRRKQVQSVKVRYIKRAVPMKDQDVTLLQLLDAIQDMKSIPDTTPDDVLRVLIAKIKALSDDEQKRLVTLALSYSPATRAVVGALFEQYVENVNVAGLKESLNKLSHYKIGILKKGLLAKKQNWNIV
jgi:hypothetical protein